MVGVSKTIQQNQKPDVLLLDELSKVLLAT